MDYNFIAISEFKKKISSKGIIFDIAAKYAD